MVRCIAGVSSSALPEVSSACARANERAAVTTPPDWVACPYQVSIRNTRMPSSRLSTIVLGCSARYHPGWLAADIALWVAGNATSLNGRSHSSTCPLHASVTTGAATAIGCGSAAGTRNAPSSSRASRPAPTGKAHAHFQPPVSCSIWRSRERSATRSSSPTPTKNTASPTSTETTARAIDGKKMNPTPTAISSRARARAQTGRSGRRRACRTRASTRSWT